VAVPSFDLVHFLHLAAVVMVIVGGQDSGWNKITSMPNLDLDLEFDSLAPVACFVEGATDDPMQNLASTLRSVRQPIRSLDDGYNGTDWHE
jgi:hypothetical protein